MSYQSIKRVLGETSLERKCRFLFGGCLLVLITASFWWCGSQTEQLVNHQNRIMGRLLVDRAMYIKHWEELETNEESLLLVKRLAKAISKEEYSARFIRPAATEGAGTPKDEFGWQVRDHLLKAQSERIPMEQRPAFFERLMPEKNEYQYYQPIYAEAESCVVCHNAYPSLMSGGVSGLGLGGSEIAVGPPLTEGDLMAVAKVTIPHGPTKKAINKNWAVLLATAIVTVFLAMIASYVIVRYVIVKPLRHLRDVSDAISHGDISQRADIHTGDEFESLAVAFNRMLRHLVTIQQELRQVNADLDGKVDELAQVNMRLYEMNMLKSDFLATMSHELRTPLNSILGFSDVLESIDSLDEKQKRYVQNIRGSGKVLLEMINDILDLAKIESGKMDTRLTEFQVEQIIRAQCDMARPLTERKNIDLEVRIESDLPPMRQDQARVQQILNNLLSNAVKFTPEGGRITVAVRHDVERGQLVMRVSDTGVGIADDDQQTIFEKFRQGHTALPSGDAMTREYSGTGLGLSIVKELCKLLGGEIAITSELGRGSTFTVRLPWTLLEQPRLDSSFVEELEDFTKPRPEMQHDHSVAEVE